MAHRPQLALLLLTGITLVVSACASKPDLDITIHQSERGAVFVERIPDRSFQATHPMTLSSDTMARVLRGVILKDDRGVVGNLASDKPETIRVFGDDDVEYLAPLLVEGLTRAASDQQVGFHIVKMARWPNRNLPERSFSRQTFVSRRARSEQAGRGASVEATGGSL